MKAIKFKVLLYSAFLYIVILTFSLAYSMYKQSEYIDNYLNTNHVILNDLLDYQMQQLNTTYFKKISHFFEKLSEDGNFDSLSIKQRKELFKDFFLRLKDENPYLITLNYFDTNNISLYRTYKPNAFGDDVTSDRPMIVKANNEKTYLYGYDIGKYTISYRIVAPIVINDKHYGAIDIGINPLEFQSYLELAVGDVEMMTLFYKNNIESNHINYQHYKDYIISHENRYILEQLKNVNFTTNTFYKYTNEYGEYALDTSIYLKNYEGENIGFLVLELNIKNIIDSFSTYIYNILISNIFISLALIIILYYAFGYYDSKIQKQKTQLTKRKNQIIHDYFHDKWTKLKNRNSLIKDLRKKNHKYLAIIDLASFSKINDIYGVEVGDIVLQYFSARLKKFVEMHNLYKVGGDQFAIKFSEKYEYNEVEKILEKIVTSLSEEPLIVKVNEEDDIDILLSVTIGIADNNYPNMLENADMALKYSKKNHKNCTLYSDKLSIKEDYSNDIMITNLVNKALEDDRVIVYFQPILKTNGEISYETLVRILNTDGTILSPFQFLEIIKNTRYYLELTKVVIKKSFAYFENRDENFSINISYVDISNKGLVEFLKEEIIRCGVGRQLIIELLEEDSLKNIELVSEFICDMKQLGVGIAIDDFGSGYSNFSYLIKLNPDYIKIDGSIIKDIVEDEKSYIITKTIINFSKELKIKVIAEYIHNKEVYESTKELGVDGFQGFYFSEPKPNLIDFDFKDKVYPIA